jgi:hypothetical protein
MIKRQITKIIKAQTMSEGVGAIVHRTIGTQGLDSLDPFLLLDEFTSTGGKDGGGFPDHPHRGFETVTYMLEGRMEHADNKGHRGIIGPGGIQWMTAGSGLVHSELPANEAGEPIRGMQLWLNLPASDKMTTPRYQEVGAEDIPQVQLEGGGKVRVIAGTFQGVSGAASDITVAPLYLDVHLQSGQSTTITLPEDHTGFVYGLEGHIEVPGSEDLIAARDLGILSSGASIDLRAGANGARALLIAARAIEEPIARHGPFVMNTREEIVQAFEDYRSGKF